MSEADGLRFDSEALTFIEDMYQRADAFLFGRRTYELFAGYWGRDEIPAAAPSQALNTKPKYVASTSLTDPQWADTTVLSGDIAAAIGELKARTGGELQVHGSGTLTRWLLANDLVDEMDHAHRPCGGRSRHAAVPRQRAGLSTSLVKSRAFPNGITLQVYRPNGLPQYATYDSDGLNNLFNTGIHLH